jgi:predicted nucleic acid-binding protein
MSAFLDTNVFVYAHEIGAFAAHRARAHELIVQMIRQGEQIVVSPQVVMEFVNVMLRKKMAAASVTQHLREFAHYRMRAPDFASIVGAWQLHETHGIGWFDALIVQCAIEAKCDTLYSEDLQHGRRFGALTVVNPFVDLDKNDLS